MVFSTEYDAALMLAALAHRGQMRRGTRVPYVMHPFHVSALLSRFGYGGTLAIAGLLHDVLEDMPFDDRQLQEDIAATFPKANWPVSADAARFREAVTAFLRVTFGDDVHRLVQAVTAEKDAAGRPSIERRRRQLAHLASAAEDEAVLKAADALHNVSTVVDDITSERATLASRVTGTPEETLWYFQQVARLARERTAGAPIVGALDEAVSALGTLVNSASHSRVCLNDRNPQEEA